MHGTISSGRFRRMHVINPRDDMPGFHGAEVFAAIGLAPRVSAADLSSTTLAAFAPSHWELRLTDEAFGEASLDGPEDEVIALTGKVTQRARIIALAAEARRRRRTVMIGGSYASLSPADIAPHADILVTGEIEEIADTLFADLEAGNWQPRYAGDRPSLHGTPVPRWDLYPKDRANAGTLQTSRGCPFPCEFCDVIAYLGRKQRHKTPAQVRAELAALHAAGHRQVFLADDNFTVHRRHAFAMLQVLREFNAAHADAPMHFLTQVSIDAARDPELLRACVEAGLRLVYIGVETVNAEGLRGAGKKQNLLQDTQEALGTFLGAGIFVMAGMIVGFDEDGPDIFDLQHDFLQASPLPLVSLGILVAPEATALHARLKAEGRLVGPAWQAANSPFGTNIVPARMSRETLIRETRRLATELYTPAAFIRRLDNALLAYGGPAPRAAQPVRIRVVAEEVALLRWLAGLGPGETALVRSVLTEAAWRPALSRLLLGFLERYAQARHVLAFAHEAESMTEADRNAGAHAMAASAP